MNGLAPGFRRIDSDRAAALIRVGIAETRAVRATAVRETSGLPETYPFGL